MSPDEVIRQEYREAMRDAHNQITQAMVSLDEARNCQIDAQADEETAFLRRYLDIARKAVSLERGRARA